MLFIDASDFDDYDFPFIFFLRDILIRQAYLDSGVYIIMDGFPFFSMLINNSIPLINLI